MPTPLPIDPFVAHILKTLRHEGHQAFVVGGAVRDALLGRPVADWDVTTSAEPVAIERIFGRVKSFRLKEGTVTLLYSGAHFEVTTFRGKGRFIEDDLSHRDFTIDAIAYDPVSCEVLDPHGGKADLARRLIKGVVDPVSRFKEDPLRLLRAVRLACELGFTIERETFSAASSCAYLIRSVSPERIRDEVLKTLLSPRPMKGFNLLR